MVFTGTKDEIQKKAKKVLGKELTAFIEKALQDPHPRSLLIAVLHRVQEELGYLSQEAMEAVSVLMQIPTAKISGVATFYHFFNLKKQGKYVIAVCLGTACHVKGADKIVKKFEEELGIKAGEMTKDGLFSLEGARCLGTCALAPVVKINQQVYPQVTADMVPKILESYFQKEKKPS
ncbi:MAG: NAD(P)H-dependent oxidoreductase subunit E [Parachlamydiales bacterium]|jgi:NADH:ubiquinone oxidoreductase subunit E